MRATAAGPAEDGEIPLLLRPVFSWPPTVTLGHVQALLVRRWLVVLTPILAHARPTYARWASVLAGVGHELVVRGASSELIASSSGDDQQPAPTSHAGHD